MLLKLQTKAVNLAMRRFFFGILVTLCVSISSDKLSAQDFQYHGFVAQGIIDVENSDFVEDDGAVSSKLTEVGFNASYQLNDNLRLAGQVVYLNGGNRYAEGVRIDYALLDWSMYKSSSWQANLYLGRFKNNHWLYSSSRDIPFARPSIILPQSVYFDGFRDIAVGGDGAALKISHSDDDYGNFDFNLSYGTSKISDKQGEIILGDKIKGSIEQDSDFQTSLYWQPSFSSWRFGISYLDSVFNYDATEFGDLFFDGKFSFKFYTINALYEGERWELSGEIYQETFDSKGFYTPTYSKAPIGQGMYIQSRYKVNDELTLLARYENFYNDRDDKNGKAMSEEYDGLIPAYFGYHRDTVIGLSYDFSSNLRLRLEYHWFQGGGRLTPVVLPNPQVNDAENWELGAVQLMYWF
ncbi:hypothetical protein Q4506_03740 [Colwellia sp. 4_MG-2023]|jgi:hypothetical protein|uniref:hypothetical protein n=1 Tax=unclassified Colwellia TaxID=196834 RepID=UPI001C09E84A|nr:MULTISPECIES: hypothetical protein [unclassified Colwellia]MBU2924132.1 hypothetical protein [Colwellia sp. C2M11]MDO6506165.1 hypothetical protein [Colwellia sp. 5_MG-2023]MDO6554775.1 hypothetical protein [Colwellia sp. 4_MG-2023]MDO6652022.1 hypothetical protein [Colwellia sp. 3_MG-2023]MDO6664798.1 hypothetical protein [Colwellia sp. 2_MG-2023]